MRAPKLRVSVELDGPIDDVPSHELEELSLQISSIASAFIAVSDVIDEELYRRQNAAVLSSAPAWVVKRMQELRAEVEANIAGKEDGGKDASPEV